MPLSRSELMALSRKYRLLRELRRRADREPPPELRLLSREFPGALRELDALPEAELERRAASVAHALSGGPAEALLEWVSHYHALMRVALGIKRKLAPKQLPNPAFASLVARAVSLETGASCDAALVLEVANPPRGRLNDVVFARLGAALGVEPAALRTALFHEAAAS